MGFTGNNMRGSPRRGSGRGGFQGNLEFPPQNENITPPTQSSERNPVRDYI